MKGSSKETATVFSALIQKSLEQPEISKFVNFLAEQMVQSGAMTSEVQKILIGLDSAARCRSDRIENTVVHGTSCIFCGRPPKTVRRMVSTAESAICEECTFYALQRMTDESGSLHLKASGHLFKSLFRIAAFSLRTKADPSSGRGMKV
jgi:ClpX C4-type zinc finger